MSSVHDNAKVQSNRGDAPCYLCGEPIEEGRKSVDHVLPKQFLKRKQPRVKGYEYGGTLPTHLKCNNEFKDEKFCQHALTLLELFTVAGATAKFTRRDNPEISFIAVTPDQLPGFGAAEAKFFGIMDVRNVPTEELKTDEFFQGKPKVDPIKKPLNTALSVLAKSACAFLLKKQAIKLPSHWRILMVPFMDHDLAFDIQGVFGALKPYDDGLYIWSGPTDNGDGAVVSRHGKLLVFTLVATSRDRTFWNRIAGLGEPGNRYLFNGLKLTELVGYEWTRKVF